MRGSDIDVVVVDTSQDLSTLIRKSEEKLVKVKRFVNVEKITCKVPIIKLKDKKTGLNAESLSIKTPKPQINFNIIIQENKQWKTSTQVRKLHTNTSL